MMNVAYTLTISVDLIHENLHLQLAWVLTTLTHRRLELVYADGAIVVCIELRECLLDVCNGIPREVIQRTRAYHPADRL